LPNYVQRVAAALQQPRRILIRRPELPSSNLTGLIVVEAEQRDSLRLVAVATSEKNMAAFDS
jgi:hypothetical protein